MWAAVYAGGLFVFMELVVHPAFVKESARPVPLFTWLGFCIGFGVVSIEAWAYFRFAPGHVPSHHETVIDLRVPEQRPHTPLPVDDSV